MSAHLDAAYNLARWLTRNEHDAQDVVQEAMLRAFMYFEGFRGADAKAWILKIVRNTCFTWLQANRPSEIVAVDAAELSATTTPLYSEMSEDPETAALRRATALQVDGAVAALAPALREVIVLREMEELSYKEIAMITDAPIGTVMSRLARGRADLRRIFARAQCRKGAVE